MLSNGKNVQGSDTTRLHSSSAAMVQKCTLLFVHENKKTFPGMRRFVFTNPSMHKAARMDNFSCLAIFLESSNKVVCNNMCRTTLNLVALYNVHQLPVFKQCDSR